MEDSVINENGDWVIVNEESNLIGNGSRSVVVIRKERNGVEHVIVDEQSAIANEENANNKEIEAKMNGNPDVDGQGEIVYVEAVDEVVAEVVKKMDEISIPEEQSDNVVAEGELIDGEAGADEGGKVDGDQEIRQGATEEVTAREDDLQAETGNDVEVDGEIMEEENEVDNLWKEYTAKQHSNAEWNVINQGLIMVIDERTSELSFDELYLGVSRLISNDQGRIVYQGVQDLLTAYIKNLKARLLKRVGLNNYTECLKNVQRQFNDAVNNIDGILMYMNNYYLPKIGKPKSTVIARTLYRETFFEDDVVARFLKTRVKKLARKGISKNIDEIIDIFGLLLDIYEYKSRVLQNDYLNVFLDNVSDKYTKLEGDLQATDLVYDYAKKVNELMDDGAMVSDRLIGLNHDFGEKVKEIFCKKLLEPSINRILNANHGVDWMIMKDEKERLIEVYKVCNRAPNGLKALANKISVYLRNRGAEMYQDLCNFDEIEYFQQLFGLKDAIQEYVFTCFNNNDVISAHILEDFSFLNNLLQEISG
ncbi:unnamed protein product [Bursaphelenchus okinawaensis]|uniref:Cullin N-terminal domain-containing protein n=1 Tax=Bursaphelenchus okinawaensis TaxID=465554 RepID=A0A811LRE4_9BILA|nr:unnamed protein product [Bursaphelenchus okinawaensis]CAG9127357.1 unnamed protein product [Bursaphelenchus okinawaensis]